MIHYVLKNLKTYNNILFTNLKHVYKMFLKYVIISGGVFLFDLFLSLAGLLNM